MALACFATTLVAQEKPVLEDRWVYLSVNFQGDGQLEKALEIAKRAKAAGYNGIMLVDYKFNVLDRVVERYFTHLAAFKKTCEELGLEIIPAVAPFGYSSGILAHNPNLAEALPVADSRMIVEGGFARIEPPKEPLVVGDFEEAKGDQIRGWGFQDNPGKASFVDTAVKHEGKQSLRFENLATNNPPSGNGRISKKIKVDPWRQYHASIWIKTEAFTSASETKVIAIDASGRTLVHSNLGVKPTQDWTLHHAVFNSLENEELTFYCGNWSGRTGKVWFDDVQLHEVAFVNLVRRDDCLLVVKGQNGETYKEGVDFEKVVDPKLGVSPWAGEFDIHHEPPRLKLTAKSKIKNGDRLLVSYFHTVTVYDGQVACELDHPEVWSVLDKQVAGVEKLLHPKRYMLSHDEIRVANWGNAGEKPSRTAGQLLADNMRKTIKLVRETNPQAKLCVWSDMFDPHHNAVKGPYYLVNGTYEGSWEGLEKGMTIINWNSGKPDESLPFFDKLGCRQVLAGYYDADPKAIAGWLAKAKGIPSVRGVMYTTWTDNFSHLEAFAEAAWGGKR